MKLKRKLKNSIEVSVKDFVSFGRIEKKEALSYRRAKDTSNTLVARSLCNVQLAPLFTSFSRIHE